jgi:hypothetical protein
MNTISTIFSFFKKENAMLVDYAVVSFDENLKHNPEQSLLCLYQRKNTLFLYQILNSELSGFKQDSNQDEYSDKFLTQFIQGIRNLEEVPGSLLKELPLNYVSKLMKEPLTLKSQHQLLNLKIIIDRYHDTVEKENDAKLKSFIG